MFDISLCLFFFLPIPGACHYQPLLDIHLFHRRFFGTPLTHNRILCVRTRSWQIKFSIFFLFLFRLCKQGSSHICRCSIDVWTRCRAQHYPNSYGFVYVGRTKYKPKFPFSAISLLSKFPCNPYRIYTDWKLISKSG